MLRSTILNRIIDRAFSKNTRDFLKVHHPITPTFYALPKIHKSLQNPPGRPIISGIGCLTHQASSMIDDYLRPHVESLPTCLKDTIYVLCTVLEGISVPTHTILASLMWRPFTQARERGLNYLTFSKREGLGHSLTMLL